MELSTKYSPEEIEDKWYGEWLKHKCFSSTPDEREAYSVVIPPPNVTGLLHMGHMLNNTIQDVLIRKARQEGKNACWVPGTDHASIATEAKVVKMLREKGIKKSDLTREKFLEYAWEWKEEYGGIILKQLQKLGASCDWDRTAFTMDEVRSDAVNKVFVDLYNKGKLYRKKRIVNWDPEALTVLSNEEVIYGHENSRLYKVKYQIEGTNDFITIATTRPETIPGDTAIAVNPNDPRYAKMKGKKAIVPIIGRVVPIIFDDYVDVEFGTGALKVTPAHDTNDFDIGERHNLEVVDVFNDNGTMSEAAGVYVGEDRFIVRKKFAKDLDAAGYLMDTEDYQNNVGRSERTNAVVEPRLSLQWYVDMKSIAAPALEAVMSDEVEFFPKNQKNVYRHWMENIRDWCISRQLWWGHRIPAYYIGEDVFVAETAEEALNLAKVKTGNNNLTISDLRQDEDVLDTWFSSWLWPISVFDGFNSREELDYYYPTSVLVTGWDIIFLWVARMVMAGYEWEGKRPFDHVYFTGMVRDKQRRKMSKSLGNSPDALGLISEYGADGVRFGMLLSSPAGGDLLFDDKLVEQGRNFSNKIWNALRLVKSWELIDQPMSELDALSVEWINNRLNQVAAELEDNFKEYKLSEGLMSIYNFVWGDFCSWYLEMIKPDYQAPIGSEILKETVSIFTKITALLHPFMPFLTEEVFQQLEDRKQGEFCMFSAYPKGDHFDQKLIDMVTMGQDIVTNVRDIRNKNGLKMRDELELTIIASSNSKAFMNTSGMKEFCTKMAILSSFELADKEGQSQIGFITGAESLFVKLEIEIDVEAELEEKQKDLVYQQGFVKSIQGKLSNDKFVSGAPAAVVDNERKKLEDGLERIKLLIQDIERLENMK